MLKTLTRAIIGRAYYSAFLHTREYLKSKDPACSFSGTGKDHSLVESKLMRKNRQLGSAIRTLRENRNMADYNLRNPASPAYFSGFGRRTLSFVKKDQKDEYQFS